MKWLLHSHFNGNCPHHNCFVFVVYMYWTIPFSNLHGLDILDGVKAMPFVDLFWKIHRVFFVIHVEGNLSFIPINNGTCAVKKRPTKNNGHAPILGYVKHHKVSKY